MASKTIDLDSEEYLGSTSLRDLTQGTDLQRINSSSSRNSKSAIINLPEVNPGKEWRLPKIDAKKIYKKLSVFHQFATSSIHISERAIDCLDNCNKMFDFPLLKPEQIKTAIKADYDFLHLGKVNIGIVPLHRKGVPVFFFTCLLDK